MNSREIAKTISKIENNELKVNSTRNYNAHVIGITGPLGVGKSTLVFQIAKHYADAGIKLGIILNDPSSENGGSFLGDRIRMQKLCEYDNVFIRSLSAKDSGGVAKISGEIINLLEEKGFEKIIIESVGAGQSEIEIANIVDTCIVVLMPGLGDEIQALKSGINEIADIFVVNKADINQAERTLRELEMLVNMRGKTSWKIPIVKTIAIKHKGINELIEKIELHNDYFKKNLTQIKKSKLRNELNYLIKYEINKKIDKKLNKLIETSVQDIINNNSDVNNAINKVVDKIKFES
ncbi:methylmalonyl Co-A mutase-associated GTPase MeaB [Candidatus Woesearchaeota archaeon]|nr:methylmalonyl Co-A mutase-associated GTPase MeaB [Candidatus Woesearchaeota archaeon]